MRIVCISDTHNCNGHVAVPDGDLLIHSGDAAVAGTADEIRSFSAWFSELPHKHKIFVAGNHDRIFESDNTLARQLLGPNIIYLQDSSTMIDGLKIYGSPWQPRFFDWAFNLSRGPEMAAKWSAIPDDVDVLITHGPLNGILDAVPQRKGVDHAGCEELRKRVETIAARGKLKLHTFGHIHCGSGVQEAFGMTFINSSVCDEEYRPVQPPRIFDL